MRHYCSFFTRRIASATAKQMMPRRLLLGLLTFAAVLLLSGSLLYGQDALVIDESGNVGIGTENPSGKLHVKVDPLPDGAASSVDSLVIDPYGNVLIGTTTPIDTRPYNASFLFVKSENAAGPLRIGSAWGVPGLWTGDGYDLALTAGKEHKVYFGYPTSPAPNYWNSWVESGTGNAYFKGNLNIGGTEQVAKLSITGSENTENGLGAAIAITNTAEGSEKNTAEGSEKNSWFLRAGATGTVTPAAGFSIADRNGYKITITKDGITKINGDLEVTGEIRTGGNIWIGKVGQENCALKPNTPTLYVCNILGGSYHYLGWDGNEFKGKVMWDGSKSDKRLKSNIHPISDALSKVSQLNGITFKWNEEAIQQATAGIDKGAIVAGPNATDEENLIVQEKMRDSIREKMSGTYMGVIGQEVQEIIPEVVKEDEDGYLNVDYSKLTAVLIEAIKELKAEKDTEIEELKAEKDTEIEKLKAKNRELESKLQLMSVRMTEFENVFQRLEVKMAKLD